MATKKDIFREHLPEWLAARGNRQKRGEMTKEISRIAKVHLKSVPRSFRRVQLASPSTGKRRGRRAIYTPDVRAALYDIWDAAHWPCGELLHPLIPEYLAGFQAAGRWRHTNEATAKLLGMSERTMKRMVNVLRQKYGIQHGQSTTRAAALKHLIPIFKGPWDNLPPGHGQLDTVAHCGESVAGDFVYTVSFVDTPLYWGVRRAQWNKGQQATKQSLVAIKARLPFPWLMGHPDTGSEFINYVAKEWCDEQGIALTRSEPGKKNDNMYVEERNGHVVRKYLGYQRLDADVGLVAIMNEYYNALDRFLNHFQAVRRTLAKTKIGAKYRRTFEKKPKTPYQRLLEHPDISPEIKNHLRQEHELLNPLLLKEQLDTLRERIYQYQKRRGHGPK